VDDKLFPTVKDTRPFKVCLPYVILPLHHYKVRCYLLSLGWEEFQDWMICPYSMTADGYEVWFSDIGKATFFKLSFVL